MEVINETENKLFNRKEIQVKVESDVTPSHEEAKKLISEKFSTQPENIRIKKIAGKFGAKVFEISANVYSSEEEKNKIEVFSKKEAEREKKPEPEKAEEPKEETPLEKEQEASKEIAEEEAKEEKPVEEKVEEIEQEPARENKSKETKEEKNGS